MLIRTFRPDDVSFATQLSDLENWGVSAAEYECLTSFEPQGCFVAEADGRPVGMIISIVYGKFGWLTSLLVASDYRRRGYGRALLDRAVGHLLDRGVRTVGLDATLEAAPFYQHAGFAPAYEVHHLQRPALPAPAPVADSFGPLEAKNLHAVAMFDWAIFGGSRHRALRELLKRSPVAYLAQDQAGVAGYLLARRQNEHWAIGPWVCVRSEEPLLTAALGAMGHEPVRLALPEVNRRGCELLAAHGFHLLRREVRMYYGDEEGIGQPQYVYAIASSEKG